MFNCKFAIKYLVLFFLIPTEFATTRTITTQELPPCPPQAATSPQMLLPPSRA
ncbi:hypothetical protein NC651_006056 [Populus alba x Populus x berolinensis]|nr:hypothetical protein NC651_006056 [Populus alba x Populus x berolinensis]